MATKTSNVMNEEIQEELNLDKKVTVRSIAGWNTTFARRVDGTGDVVLPPNGAIRLSRNEIIAQVQNGNRLFSGTDGFGSHATIYIEDKPTRIELDFETENESKKQIIFSDAVIANLFKAKNYASFEKNFRETIVTRAEKYAAIGAVRRLKLNDYDKIRFVEEYTGYRL